MEEVHHRLCDYCDSSVALLYCKADSAKLCLSCDNQVHLTNQLFSKHFRSLLCDSCHDSPSSVFCHTESSVFCQNCDWQHHSSSSFLHTRRPVEGFSGCPSVTDFLALVGLDDLTLKSMFPDSVSGGSEVVSLNDLFASSGSGHNFRPMDIPPLHKNRNATCGKHKEEIIRQLRELEKSKPICPNYETLDAELDDGFQFLTPEKDEDLFSTCEVSGLKWFEFGGGADKQDEVFPYCCLLKNLDEKSDNMNRQCDRCCPQETSVMVPVCSTTRSTLPNHEINNLERNSAISRYKEKKKSRRYEKHIRYESRKVRAESRTRIRGRFAKTDP